MKPEAIGTGKECQKVCCTRADGTSRGNTLLRCPVCGWESCEQGWDGGGADPGCMFCLGCNTEINVDVEETNA